MHCYSTTRQTIMATESIIPPSNHYIKCRRFGVVVVCDRLLAGFWCRHTFCLLSDQFVCMRNKAIRFSEARDSPILGIYKNSGVHVFGADYSLETRYTRLYQWDAEFQIWPFALYCSLFDSTYLTSANPELNDRPSYMKQNANKNKLTNNYTFHPPSGLFSTGH